MLTVVHSDIPHTHAYTVLLAFKYNIPHLLHIEALCRLLRGPSVSQVLEA